MCITHIVHIVIFITHVLQPTQLVSPSSEQSKCSTAVYKNASGIITM